MDSILENNLLNIRKLVRIREMKKSIIAILFVLFGLFTFAQPIHVLFLGNSITASGIPDHFREFAAAKGKVVFTEHYWGGQLLREYVQDQSRIDQLKLKLTEKPWDYVVLQENSAVGGFYPGWIEGYFEFYSYMAAKQITDIIRQNNPCTEVVFFMTYGYINGDVMNFPTDNYLKHQTRIRRNYKLLADSNSAIISPVGMVWKKIRDNETWNQELYASPADHHPGIYGSYLAGCTFFASIFNEDPSNSSYNPGLDTNRVKAIFQAVKSIVLDSSSVWNLNINVPDAGFSFKRTDKTIKFKSDKISKLVTHKWYFGDGDSSVVANPSHTYLSDKEYIVKHIVYSNCYSTHTFIDTITINTASIKDLSNKVILKTAGKNQFEVHSENPVTYATIYDLFGKKIAVLDTEKHNQTHLFDLNSFSSGIYILEILTTNQQESFKIIVQ